MAASLLGRVSARWPLGLALVFCIYAVVLLGYAFHSREQLRTAADARLVAEGARRAAMLGESVQQLRSEAAQLAAIHEISTYLTNEALGMSPRYGLDANLDAIEQRFRMFLADARRRNDDQATRIVFVGRDGVALVDTDDKRPKLPGPAIGATAAGPALRIFGDGFLSIVPVSFRGEFSGHVVLVGPMSRFYNTLMQLESAGSYHETLLTDDGNEIEPVGSGLRFTEAELAKLKSVVPGSVTPLHTADRAGRNVGVSERLAVKTGIADSPIVLVMTVSSNDVYGHIGSSWFLLAATIFPIAVLVVAIRLDGVQRQARRFKFAADRSDNQRQVLEGQNEDLRREIDRREAAERELESHRANLEALVAQRTSELDSLFHALPDLYFRMQRDGIILDFRAGRESDLFVPPEQFLGKRTQDILPAEVESQFKEAIRDINGGSRMEVFEYGLNMPSGQEYFEARVLPLDREQLVVVIRNITDRRAIDEIREAHRAEAERLARVKSEFLANMSHEIRTPLNGVLGMARIGLRESYGRGKSRNAFERILQSGSLLLGIVNDILDFSKIEAGRLTLECVPVNIARTVAHVTDLFSDRAAAKEIILDIRLDESLPAWHLGDPLRIEQILVNLVSNAVKFTERGKVSIDVAASTNGVVLTVEDSGIGMKKSDVDRLFTPFEQGDGSTTRRFGGTGLGLAITSRLVDLMSGQIDVESAPGQGSKFRVSLPLPRSAEVPMLSEADPVCAGGGLMRLAGIRVLVAEDVELNRVVLEEFLQEEGAVVELVVDGHHAVDAVRSNAGESYDVVLMDVQMPEMDGFEATRQIRAIAPDLPVIGQSAHAMHEDRQRCIACGMVDHVAKPIDIESLVNTILRHAQRVSGPAIDSLPVPKAEHGQGADADDRSEAARRWEGYISRFGSRPGMAARITRAFLVGHETAPADLRRVMESQDFEALAFLAHKIKGTVGNLRLGALHDRFKEIEAAARERDPRAFTLAAAVLDPLEGLLDEARAYLAPDAATAVV